MLTKLLTDYTYHPLPDLGSQSRVPVPGALHASHPLPFSLSSSLSSPSSNNAQDIAPKTKSLLRAALTSVLTRHIDMGPDFLFGETDDPSHVVDPESSLVRVFRSHSRIGQGDGGEEGKGETTWNEYAEILEKQLSSCPEICLDDLRWSLGLYTSSNPPPSSSSSSHDLTNPLPVTFLWPLSLSSTTYPGAYIPHTLLLGAHLSSDRVLHIDALADSTLINHPSLTSLLAHAAHTLDILLSRPSSPLSSCPANTLPQSLLSVVLPSQAPPTKETVLSHLFSNAQTYPSVPAHEIYSSLPLSPSSSPGPGPVPEILTYKALNKLSSQFAAYLLSHGIKHEDKVALCSARTTAFYVAMAGIWKAGGCYVSIDPELPDERKRYIVDDSGARIVLLGVSESGTFPAPSADANTKTKTIVLTTELMDTISQNHPTSDISLASPSSLAYLLYTSGTTGTPKGCLITHAGLFAAMQSFSALPKPVTIPGKDKRLALASTAFDVHISDTVQCWHLAITLVSAPRFSLLSSLRDHIRRMGITHVGMVPSMIEGLLGSPEDEVGGERLGIKYLVSGGEKITDSLLGKWAGRAGVVLANFYGPTETTIGCTSRSVSRTDRKENIGKPFESVLAVVIDPSTREVVPIGCTGELVVGGCLVARGYHNLPEATAKSFVDFSVPGLPEKQRVYRTGDLVRMMPDRSLEITGRIDQQVKYRGVRIEPEGVSSILKEAFPGFVDSYQAGKGDRDEKEGNEEEEEREVLENWKKGDLHASTFITRHPAIDKELLVSFIAPPLPSSVPVPNNTKPPELLTTPAHPLRLLIQSLKSTLDRKLPAYQRPAYIVPVTRIPLTLNGKVDSGDLGRVFAGVGVGGGGGEVLDGGGGK